jgi:hypothetical protein
MLSIVLYIGHNDQLELLEMLEALCGGVEDSGVRTVDELGKRFGDCGMGEVMLFVSLTHEMVALLRF